MILFSRPLLCLAVLLTLSACDTSGLLKQEYQSLADDFISQAPPSVVSSASTKAPVFVESGDSVSHVIEGDMQNRMSAPSHDDDVSDSVEIFDLDSPRSVASMSPAPVSAPMMQQPAMMNMSYEQVPFAAQELPTNDSSVTIYSLGDTPDDYGMAGFYGARGNQKGVELSAFAGADSSLNMFSAQSGESSNKIFFKHGSSRLGTGDLRKISNLAGKAKFVPVDYITVSGYASRPTQVGSNSTEAQILNLRQALKRSEKVAKELVRQGVPGDKIKTVGWGAGKASGNEVQDRRVDISMGER